MEQQKTEEWLAQFNAQIDAAYQFSFPVRDRELQAKAADDLARYHSVLDTERLRLRDENDTDAANLFLGLCCFSRSVTRLLRMWLAIRDDEPNKAWDLLIGAQSSAGAAMRAHQVCANRMEHYSRHLEMLELVLFPRQQFVSASFVIKKSDCSLCDAPFHKCDHVAGYPYNGEFCTEVVRETAALEHVAIVDFPYDKRCRTMSFSDDDFDVDTLTMRRTPRVKDNKLHTFEAIVMVSAENRDVESDV